MKTNFISQQFGKYAFILGVLVATIGCNNEDDTTMPIADVVKFNNVSLSAKQEVPQNTSNATGSYSLDFDKNSNILSYTINYSGTTPTAMHFHKGDVGVPGDVQAEVPGPYSSGMKGSLTLTDAQEQDLLAGKLYLNVHSADFPAGVIRGQAVMENQIVFSNISLSGSEEVPSNNSTASGVLNGVYDQTSKMLAYNITSTGLTSTAMHIHKAGVGVNGDVVVEVSGMSGTTPAFTTAQETDLLAGNLYLNVHSAEHPGGEVRGQLVSDKKIVFSNLLSGQNEVDPSGSTATGTFYGVYDNAAKSLSYVITFADLTPTAMHFHKGAVGANGGVELEVAGPYTSGMSGAVTLSAAQESDLFNGLLYLNVHSELHPGGEIRAQLIK